MHRTVAATLFGLWLGLAAGCAAPGPAPTATQDPEALAQQTRAAGTEAAAATQSRQTEAAGDELATEVVLTRVRSTEVAAERRATQVQRVTATAAKATAQSQSMQRRVQELYDQGYLATVGGTYHNYGDFIQSWAQLNWYRWWRFEEHPTDFVLRTDMTWESASDTADWWNSGCGFVFRVDPNDNHYLVYLALDGRLYFERRINDRPGLIASPFVARPELPTGHAMFEMIAEGSWFTFFVNGEEISSRQDTALPEGEVALTLVSGTNKGFGTRCLMRSVELWEFE